MPKVTILMPVYNGERFLREAIDSALRQTFADFELLIIDDGSTDNTAAILRDYDDSRIRVIRNPGNKGESFSRNLGLRQALGEYIAVLDADDVAFEDRLQKQVAFLDVQPEVGLLGAGGQWITADGANIGLRFSPPDHTILCWLLLFRNPLIHSATMYRRELALRVGGYDERLAQAQDFMLWNKMAEQSRITSMMSPVVKIRRNPASVSRANWATLHDCAIRVVQQALSGLLGREIAPETASFLNDPTLAIAGQRPGPRIIAPALLSYKKCLLLFARSHKLTPAQSQVILRIVLGDLTLMADQCTVTRPLVLWTALRGALSYAPKQIFQRAFIRFTARVLAPSLFRRLQ